MRQKIYTFLLTALLGLLGVNAWAEDYEISCAEDLAAFAQAVNGGEYDANATLTADIDMADEIDMNGWTAIGDWHAEGCCYKGHFDGQGHKITGFNATSSHNYYGIFGVVSTGALIENFSIYGTLNLGHKTGGVVAYTRDTSVTIRNIQSYLNINVTEAEATAQRPGGIVGSAVNGTTNIENCSYSGTLNVGGHTGNIGGIVGYVNNNTAAIVNITNCLFDGEIQNGTSADGQCGGMVGYNNKGVVTIKNCLSIGTIEAKSDDIGQFFGRLNNNNSTFINNYYVGDFVNGTAGGGTAKGTAPTKVTAEQLASGEVCYLLNGDQTEIGWFQKLKTKTFYAEQYVVTANGTTETPTTADITLTEASDGTFTFTLPDFVLKIIGRTYNIGTISLTGIEIGTDGTFSETGTYDVPDENIPSGLSAYASFFKNIPYTLDGKVNSANDKFYAVVDLTVMGNTVNVVAGEDDFTAAAPIGEAYPKPFGTDIVYPAGRSHCDGTAYEGVTGYSNTASAQDDHDFADGFCSYCGAIDENYMTPNADGFFEIANEQQLIWFAAYVNQVSVAANAILTADIALTKTWTLPIGTGSGNSAPGATAYTGTFDGQGYTISGFNAEGAGHLGLFGDTKDATIKNFTLSGSLTVTSGYGGGVVAWPINTTIENVHSALAVSVPNSGTHHVGGVVGSARGGNTITGCSFTGSITVAAGSTDNFAGIAAYITNGDNVTNCANYGNITFSDAGCAAGGIVGYLNSTSATIKNCLTVGAITFNGEGDPKYGGAILGRTKGFSSELVTNNYWLEGSAYAASKKDDGTDPLAVGSVTAAQLASGEVAYKLGEAWYQLIGTDETPVLDQTSPKVYEIAVTDAGYATFVPAENVLAIPEGVTAYVGQQYATYVHLEEVTELPADNAFILKADEGAYYYNCTEETRTITADNDLLFSDTEVVADGTQYVVATVNDVTAFYQVNEGTTIAARKAYITCSSGVKAFHFDDDATGISNVNTNLNANDTNDTIYNLAGQRLTKMQKGINIVGNKKVLY